MSGLWVAAIPEAYRGLRYFCPSCPQHFWSKAGYRQHYRLEHLMTGIPSHVKTVMTLDLNR
jgi:hypothetical protein